MKKFLLPIELKDENFCYGCHALGQYASTYFSCEESKRDLPNRIPKRPDWCPLIERREHKIEPSSLTQEEMAEYEREIADELSENPG